MRGRDESSVIILLELSGKRTESAVMMLPELSGKTLSVGVFWSSNICVLGGKLPLVGVVGSGIRLLSTTGQTNPW
jgi:hypothetical protein